jgi:hypothetical protein
MARLGYKKSRYLYGIHSLGMESGYEADGRAFVRIGFNHPYEGWVVLAAATAPTQRGAFCEAMTAVNDELVRREEAVVATTVD